MNVNPFRTNLIDDIFAVLRPLWFIVVFEAIVATALIALSPAQDVMLIILEDSMVSHLMPFICFFLAMLFWSITSEFGSRFILYLSDTSSHNLSPDRVHRRKKIANVYSAIVLLLPIVTMAAGFIRVTIANFSEIGLRSLWIVFLVIILLAILILIYFSGKRKHFALYNSLQPSAQSTINHLTGILQERHIPVSEAIDKLAFDQLSSDGKFVIRKPRMSDFKPLFNRFYTLLAIAVVTIVIFFLLNNDGYVAVGPLATIAAGFASWFTVYYAIEMLDKVQPFRLRLPYKFIVVVVLLFSSWKDNDHPVWPARPGSEKHASAPSLQEHFLKWQQSIKSTGGKDTITVVFVAAEGGALRTGLLTAMTLAKLQETYPQITDRIYALSSVSGGTLGANFYNAVGEAGFPQNRIVGLTEEFFKQDFLAPVTGKLAFTEVANYFYPHRYRRSDREFALERSWELGFQRLGGKRIFGADFDSIYLNSGVHRALFIHTTRVEGGLRAIYSNVSIDPHTFPTAFNLHDSVNGRLRYSSVIGLSTRFPLISPAGELPSPQNFHYVDGGYYENRGATTLIEVIEAVERTNVVVIPYVILFAFGDDTADKGGYQTIDELASILNGIYNVRGGHTDHATELLKRLVGNDHFVTMTPPSKTPMNWVFSQSVIEKVKHNSDMLLDKHKSFLQDLTKDIQKH